MKISETGRRRFIIYDTESHSVTTAFITNPKIYFVENFVVFPLDDEVGYLSELIRQRIVGWGLPEEFNQRVFVKVSVTGYTSSRSEIDKVVREEFKRFNFYDEHGPCLDALEKSNDPDRDFLAQEVKSWIDELDWDKQPPEPNKDEILVEALKTIYGAR